jgi:hypothetical protein
MSDERDSLFDGLPPYGDDEAWARFQSALARRRRDCPFAGDLIELASGRADPAAEPALREHLDGCSYCRALYEGYRRALEESAEPVAVGAEEEVGEFTDLKLSGNWAGLEDRLRPYVPEVLEHVGLDAALAEPLLRFILKEAPDIKQQARRVRDLMPGWVEEFARTQKVGGLKAPLRREDWEALIERGAVRRVLREADPQEPDWARQFRELALGGGVCSQEGLLRFAPEALASVPGLPRLRRRLLARSLQEQEQALDL